jgi:hypothetical protein
LQRQFGHKHYEPIWALLHKLQAVMGRRDSDDSTSYTNFRKLIAEHRPKIISKNLIGTAVLWVHIAISNAKRVLLDVFHDINPEYLQNYLNEFCFKFNRRYLGKWRFERLLVALAACKYTIHII